MSYYRGYGSRVATFLEENVVQTKGRWAGDPLRLEEWERDFLDELFLVDGDQNFVYREALLGVPRKNGKSTLAAGVALYGLLGAGEEGPEVYAAAGSQQQARVVFDQAVEFVRMSPRLMRYLKPMRSVIRCQRNNGIFRAVSAEALLQYGPNPNMVVIDEFFVHKDPELYYALTTGQLARVNPLVVAITTAGWDRNSICWEVHERGKALHEKGLEAMRKARFLFRWYEASHGCDVHDRAEWDRANPASWITHEDLEREVERLPENVFRRLHLNQWTEVEDAWISPAWWDACIGDPELDPDEETWMMVDIGLKRDARAIVMVQWHDDELLVEHDIAIPEKDRPLSASDARQRVRQHAGRFSALREVCYDPWSFRESAEMLGDEGFPMVEYEQGNARMSPASERTYELIREGRLVHDGDEVFRSQVLAAVVSETERGWRASKRKSKERIDGAIALICAADRAILGRMGKPKTAVVF